MDRDEPAAGEGLIVLSRQGRVLDAVKRSGQINALCGRLLVPKVELAISAIKIDKTERVVIVQMFSKLMAPCFKISGPLSQN